MSKPTLKYKVVNGKNPKTGEYFLRPLIVDLETLDTNQVVDFAKNSGYIRGQIEDLKGNANGLFEAIKKLTLMGKAVNLANWIRVRPVLSGTLGETRQLTAANELNVAVASLTNLKVGADEFSWTNIDDTGVIPRIYMILSPGGKEWEITDGGAISVTGKNLAFNPAYGDSVTLSYVVGDATRSIPLTPIESDSSQLRFKWTTELDDVPANTKLTITIRTTAGIEGGSVYTLTREVTLVAA